MAGLIGKIRHRLQLEEPVLTSDGSGGFDENWAQVASIWGFIRPKGGRKHTQEIVRADQMTSAVTYEIIIRQRNGVTAQMRFLFGSRTFNIRSVSDPDGRGQWLSCICEERT